jgi:hypothetical protein
VLISNNASYDAPPADGVVTVSDSFYIHPAQPIRDPPTFGHTDNGFAYRPTPSPPFPPPYREPPDPPSY